MNYKHYQNHVEGFLENKFIYPVVSTFPSHLPSRAQPPVILTLKKPAGQVAEH